MEPNIIVFGETGAGKSSVINMLDGSPDAPVSNGAAAPAGQDICYKRTIEGKTFNVFDTAGFNQGPAGTVSPPDAIRTVYDLCCRSEGISLLVFVMQPPIRPEVYKIFYEIVCNKTIPIVIVITHLERESDMDVWFDKNQEEFRKEGMIFGGNACITTKIQVEGRVNAYEMSKKKVEQVICKHFAREPLKIDGRLRRGWFADVIGKVVEMLGWKSDASELHQLLKACGLNEEEARKLSGEMRGRGN